MILLTFEECDPGFLSAWRDKGFEVHEKLDKQLGTVDELILYIRSKLAIGKQVYAFTFDFYPTLAEACHVCRIIYISWVWDSPHMTLWSKRVRYDTNKIFLFDRDLHRKLCSKGIDNVFYLPLAVDVSFFAKTISEDKGASEGKWGCDVAFVGNLYNDKKTAMFDSIEYLPPYIEGYLDAIIKCQTQIWGGDIVEKSLSEEVWEELQKYIKLELGNRYEEDLYRVMVIDMIHRKASQIERKIMCSTLARMFSFVLYSGSDTSYDPMIRNKGYVNYLTEMPLVFHYSKINIQITIRAITSGISKRVLDVLGCEGFLLTNYQPEIAEYFVDGKELVMYDSMEDLCIKIAYYLEHNEERKAIAHAGYLKVCELFSYENMISRIVDEI